MNTAMRISKGAMSKYGVIPSVIRYHVHARFFVSVAVPCAAACWALVATICPLRIGFRARPGAGTPAPGHANESLTLTNDRGDLFQCLVDTILDADVVRPHALAVDVPCRAGLDAARARPVRLADQARLVLLVRRLLALESLEVMVGDVDVASLVPETVALFARAELEELDDRLVLRLVLREAGEERTTRRGDHRLVAELRPGRGTEVEGRLVGDAVEAGDAGLPDRIVAGKEVRAQLRSGATVVEAFLVEVGDGLHRFLGLVAGEAEGAVIVHDATAVALDDRLGRPVLVVLQRQHRLATHVLAQRARTLGELLPRVEHVLGSHAGFLEEVRVVVEDRRGETPREAPNRVVL